MTILDIETQYTLSDVSSGLMNSAKPVPGPPEHVTSRPFGPFLSLLGPGIVLALQTPKEVDVSFVIDSPATHPAFATTHATAVLAASRPMTSA